MWAEFRGEGHFHASGTCCITSISDTHWASFRLVLVMTVSPRKPGERPRAHWQRPIQRRTGQPVTPVTKPSAGLSAESPQASQESVVIFHRETAWCVSPKCGMIDASRGRGAMPVWRAAAHPASHGAGELWRFRAQRWLSEAGGPARASPTTRNAELHPRRSETDACRSRRPRKAIEPRR